MVVDKKDVAISSNLQFNWLSALAGHEDNVEKYFDYELATHPMSLFKDGYMRKPDKANLRNLLLVSEVDRVYFQGKLLMEEHSYTMCTGMAHGISQPIDTYCTCHIVFLWS